LIRTLIPTGSKVLVAPLNWGLGHATRSIPIIKELLENNCTVFIASDGDSFALLRMEFPSLTAIELPSYDIHYEYKSMAANMLLQLPKILKTYNKELKIAQELQEKHQFSFIISDGRYGIRAKGVINYFIGHQLQIQSWNPVASYLATKVNKSLINQYEELWIPDEENHLLSGKLSDVTSIHKHRFIGVLTRMRSLKLPQGYDIAIILSGPEPARTVLEKKILDTLENIDKKIAFVRGIEKATSFKKLQDEHPTINFYGRLNAEKLNQIICASGTIICRAGYSSIMDLYTLEKKAILIPTPGQTEQEYLGKHLDQYSLFTFIAEKNISEMSKFLM